MRTLALVGVGSWGRNIIKEISNISDCKLKYICAQNKQSLDSISGNYIKLQDYKELLNYDDIDGVIIATLGSTHFEIAATLLEEGLNLFIEKPLTTDYKDALKLKEIAQKKGSVILVGHIYLYNPAILKIKELLDSLGTIQYITFEGLNNGPLRSDMSVLWEWAPHGVSICLDFLQQKPLSVSAWAVNKLRPSTKLYDMFFMNLEFPNNIRAIIKGSWLSPIKKRELMVVGSGSTIVFDDSLVEKKVVLFKGIGPSIEGSVVVKNEGAIDYPGYSEQSSLSLELLEFLRCIKNKNTPKTNMEQGVEVVKIIELAEKSIEKNGEVIPIN